MPDMIQCPIKRYPVSNQEVISEALGYVLAKSCGFKVPDIAGIILLERSQIPPGALEELRKIECGSPQPSYLCWFSKDMEYPNLAQKHLKGIQVEFLRQRRLKRLVRELIEAADSPKVIAFDDWLFNSDRHPGNLLSAGTSLMLIDHGRILIYPNWKPGDLGSLGFGQVPENRLRNFIDSHEPKWSAKLPKSSEMIMAYNSFSVSFRDQGEGAARKVLEDFFDAVDIDAIIHLLKSRHDPAAYAKASGMVL